MVGFTQWFVLFVCVQLYRDKDNCEIYRFIGMYVHFMANSPGHPSPTLIQ